MKSNAPSRPIAEVRPLDPSDSVDGPLFAINWVDTRWPLLYSIYMGLASRLVRKIGGVPIFKGHTQQTLAGSEADARDILLIVRYPSASSFLSLVLSRTFQVVSLLRITAVRSLSFVFNRRLDAEPMSAVEPVAAGSPEIYGALLFSSKDPPSRELARLTSDAHRHGVRLHFFSAPMATLSLSRSGSGAEDISYVTDRVALVSADSAEQLQDFATSQIATAPPPLQKVWMGRMERSI